MPVSRKLSNRDLFDNPTPRLPVALVLDCSPSMSGETRLGAALQQTNPSPIDELNKGAGLFYDDILGDPLAASSAEVCVISYADTPLLITEFDSINRQRPPRVDLRGSGTDIGSAVDLALDHLDGRKTDYQEAGVDYFQPWLVLMSDGAPNVGNYKPTAKKVRERIEARKLVSFPVGVGDGADMRVMQEFTIDDRPAMPLGSLSFTDFFMWLSQSVQVVSQSMPGERLTLPPRTWSTEKPDQPWI